MKKNARILLQINSSRIYGRSLFKGIINYAKNHTNWLFWHEIPYYLGKTNSQTRFKKIKAWKPDGIIIREAHTIEQLFALKKPTIVCPNVIVQPNLKKQMSKYPGILTDCGEIGKMAAAYFLEKGYKNFAFTGYKKSKWSALREQSFCESIEKAGLNTFTLSTPANWSTDQAKGHLSQWLKELPKPVAVMACNDDRGLEVIETCKSIKLHVPEEVAVLGVDNDVIVCEMANPTLSSIVINAEKAGYDAAKLLHQMISKEAPKQPEDILVLPQYVQNRQSTDITAIDDTDVAQALNFIRNNVHQNLQVNDVVNSACLSRRNLELKFRRTIGRSIHFEIRRMRAESISRMLLETNLPIYQIALEFGFNDPVNIARFFRKEMGLSLHEYRKQYKL